MKKLIAILVIAAFAVSAAACGNKTENVPSEEITTELTTEATTTGDVDASTSASPEEGEYDANTSASPEEGGYDAGTSVSPEGEQPQQGQQQKPAEQPSKKPAASDTVAKSAVKTFNSIMKSNADASAEDIAALMVEKSNFDVMLGSISVEEGYLNGFTDEVKGFKEGAQFAPMIGTIPFVGYIFQLDNGADVDAFVSNLKKLADKRWNICTEADDLTVTTSGNTVFFLMSPTSFDE